jgi:hypothetical protein
MSDSDETRLNRSVLVNWFDSNFRKPNFKRIPSQKKPKPFSVSSAKVISSGRKIYSYEAFADCNAGNA